MMNEICCLSFYDARDLYKLVKIPPDKLGSVLVARFSFFRQGNCHHKLIDVQDSCTAHPGCACL